MRSVCLAVIILSAFCLLTDPAKAQDESAKDQKKGGIFSNLPLFSRNAGEKKMPAKKQDITIEEESSEQYVPTGPTSAEIFAREEANYFRREAVCDKLMDIALQTVDQDLQRKAEQLLHRSWEFFQKRTNQLSVGRTPGEGMPPGVSASPSGSAGGDISLSNGPVIDVEK